jgi:hypothetical protein
MNDTKGTDSSNGDALQQEKVESLQKMIDTAEQTITSARQMLAQMQGGTSRQSKYQSTESKDDGKVVYGNFDGQIMVGDDGKQYPVPANYASKSKIVEGDMLKLIITPDGSFIYKQVGPVERKYLIGIIEADERGNYIVNAEGKKYKVLLAAATYFKIEFGDEVTLVVPRDHAPIWGAIENVLRKAEDVAEPTEAYSNIPEDNDNEKTIEENQDNEAINDNTTEIKNNDVNENDKINNKEEEHISAIERLQKEIEEERKKKHSDADIIDEWMPDIEQIKKEASHPAGVSSDQSEK